MTDTAQAPAINVFPPLEQETRPYIPTAQAAYYLTLRPQTLREWSCYGRQPEGLRFIRLGKRLAWSVTDIKKMLGV